MTDIASRYRSDGDVLRIQLRLTSVDRLFDARDPSPLHEKDLHDDVHDWLVDTVDELPRDAPLRLELHVPAHEAGSEPRARVREAIRTFYAYREDATRLELRRTLREGRFTLLVAALFLAGCVAARALILSRFQGAWVPVADEGLLIVGWVAMWRPLDLLLYAGWPLRRRMRLLARLAQADVDLRPV